MKNHNEEIYEELMEGKQKEDLSQSEKEELFVVLRARGFSYDEIAKRIGVSKRTLIWWAKEMHSTIANLKSIEVDKIQKTFILSKAKRLEFLGKQLDRINKALEAKENLDELTLNQLFTLSLKVLVSIREEDESLRFREPETRFKAAQEWDAI